VRLRLIVVAAVALIALTTLSLASAAGGDLDPSFGDGGKVVTRGASGGGARATEVAVQLDGKVVVLGRAFPEGPMLVRYLRDGSLDTGFGNGGRAATFGGGDPAASALAVQEDGRILVAGATSAGDAAVARHRSDGSLDVGFGTGGVVTTDFGGDDVARSVIVRPDGKIVAAGGSYSDGVSRFTLARYRRDGRLDPSFGNGGKVLRIEASMTDAAVAPDGRVVVLGETHHRERGFERLVLARFTARGGLDRSFSADGIATAPAIRDRGPSPTAIAVQQDGKVVAVNTGNVEGTTVFAVLRYRSNGLPDRRFGERADAGDQGGDFPFYSVLAVDLDSRGRIVIAGSGPDLRQNFAVARLTPDGRLDRRFTSAGRAITDFGAHDFARAVAVGEDGKVVAAGVSETCILFTCDSAIAVVRYLASSCRVPTVNGKRPAAARREIRLRNCVAGTTRRAFSRRVPRGRVISQRPAPGTNIADHIPVTLVVSRGPPP
jgi:uncharacterized delta-60 repeat protein